MRQCDFRPGEQLIARCASTPGGRGDPGVGGRVRYGTGLLPAGTVENGGAAGTAAAGLVDTAASLGRGLSRGDRMFERVNASLGGGLDLARPRQRASVQDVTRQRARP